MAGRKSFVLWREWPLIAAILGIASLALLPTLARSPELRDQRERQALDELKRRVDLDPAATEPLLRAFIAAHPESHRLPEARFFLGKAIIQRGRAGEFPGPYALGAAWTAISSAREGGFEAARTWELQREIARQLDERGYFREATLRFSEIHRAGVMPDAALDLARTLAKRALRDPAAREALLDEAASRISEYLRTAPPEKRLRAFLTQSDIYWRAGRYSEILPLLLRELREFPSEEDQGRLYLELGKALTRQHRHDEALEALDRAEQLLGETSWRDHAVFFKAVLHQRAGEPECAELCERLFRLNSPLVPVARLVLGLYELEVRAQSSDPIGALSAGLAEIRRPAIFDEAGFDFDEFYRSVRQSWVKEEDRATLVRTAALYRDLTRLYPASTAYVRDHALVWLKAGEHAKAAERFLALAALVGDPAERERAVHEAADACAAAKDLHARAATLYRKYFELNPKANAEGLYLQAQELQREGCYRSPRTGESDALSVFAEYIQRARPEDPLLPKALLQRGRMLAELGLREDAVEEFGRLLSGTEGLAIDPTAPEWAEALLGRGRALLELVVSMPAETPTLRRRKLAAEGRNDLREYLERYSERFDHRAGSVEASSLLARSAILERDWPAAMEALARIESLTEPGSEERQQARFLKGDALFGQGQWDRAVEAYSAAYRADLTSDDRLWGLIGRARAYVRLGRREEARRDFENGRAIYDGRKEMFDRSLAGKGKDIWGPALQALGKELLP